MFNCIYQQLKLLLRTTLTYDPFHYLFFMQVLIYSWLSEVVFLHKLIQVDTEYTFSFDLPLHPLLAAFHMAFRRPKTHSPGSAMRTTRVNTRKIMTHFILKKTSPWLITSHSKDNASIYVTWSLNFPLTFLQIDYQSQSKNRRHGQQNEHCET